MANTNKGRDIQALLDELRLAAHEQYPDHPDRLAQFDSHLDTAAMVYQHMADEEVRHKHRPKAHARAVGAYMPDEEE
jgi:uncharacterized membrane protein